MITNGPFPNWTQSFLVSQLVSKYESLFYLTRALVALTVPKKLEPCAHAGPKDSKKDILWTKQVGRKSSSRGVWPLAV